MLSDAESPAILLPWLEGSEPAMLQPGTLLVHKIPRIATIRSWAHL
jgi:hypothetical protein